MFCIHCGKEIENGTAFCSFCGGAQATASPEVTTEETGVLALFHSVFGDTKFHLATLFFLVATCASALAGIVVGSVTIPILQIFIIISLFKLDKLGKEGAPLLAFAAPLKTIRIIMNVYRIFLWIFVALFGIFGVIFCASGPLLGSAFVEVFDTLITDFNIPYLAEFITDYSGIIFLIFGIMFIVVAVICALFNVFMYGAFYKTAKSTEWTAGTGNYIVEKIDATSGWLKFSVVMSAISMVFTGFSTAQSVLTVVSLGFNIAFLVIALELLKKLKKQ